MQKSRLALIGGLLIIVAARANAGAERYERMTADSLRAALSQAHGNVRPQLTARNLANLNFAGIDFRGANLSASVFNGAKLDHARSGQPHGELFRRP